MHLEIADDSLTAAVRRIVREELAVFFELRVAELRGEQEPGAGGSTTTEREPTPEALKDVSPYDRVRFAEYILEEADGGPLHVRAIAEGMYRIGYKHRRQPKHPEQILSSLNSLASPSQHPERFKRSGARSLELVR
jgi:hypothetical protein